VDTQPLAKYDPRQEVWRASLPPARAWHSFRIVSAEVISALADAEEGEGIAEVRLAQSVTFHVRR
jgi:hypothetical protein